ncbi:hypothetical protein IC582_010337 [Cucumis melo]
MTSSLALGFSMFLLLPISLHATDELISLLPETTVTIVNEVGGPLLGIHCRSKQDDLGVNVVSSDKSYSFNFRPNVWGTTLFYCVFEWVKGQPHYFTIYDFKRDGKTCTNCRWLFMQVAHVCNTLKPLLLAFLGTRMLQS